MPAPRNNRRRQEEFLNQQLAFLLQKRGGIETDYEVRQAGKRIDVVADVDGLIVVLEAETGFHRKAQAIRDADARLRQKLASVVLAVCYPDDVTQANLGSRTLTWLLRLQPGEPPGEWATGDVTQLAQAVLQAPRSLSGADAAARLLSDGLDAMVQRLRTPGRRSLAIALDLPRTKPGNGPRKDGYFVAAKRGMLVAATAMLFHHRVQAHLPARRPRGFDGNWPPPSLATCAGSATPVYDFRDAWRGILAVDYRPVFETGRTALAALPSNPDIGLAVSRLADTVGKISALVSGLHHDLLGRVFHRVLDTARYDGSFYTSTTAATLLAALAIREDDCDWSKVPDVSALRICDPACGTGTLLMAAAERISSLHNSATPGGSADEARLSGGLVEDVLWGYDVNVTATHMAASTLGMLSPTTRFSRMNIHRARLGVFDGEPYLGSLDLLSGNIRLASSPSTTEQVENGQATGEQPPAMDLVIMNPPFTRDSLRHDQFSREDELAIKEREKDMLEGQPYREAARLSGSANAFMVLGDKMVSEDTGTLAVVLPTVMSTNPAALQTRRYMAQRFHIDTIVSSHDPSRIFFSESTNIGEILLVCRRWKEDAPKPPTRVVNLARNPATPLDALDTAHRIARAVESDSQTSHDFTVQQVTADRIERGDWFAVNFLSPFLVESYRAIGENFPGSVPTAPLSQLAAVGPAGQRIRDSYTASAMPTVSGRRALWHHKTDVTQSMLAETDVYIEPKEAKRHLADRYWEQRSQLLLPHRLRLNLARVVAVMLPERAVGSIWTPCRPQDPEIAKALCLYLNSAPGILSLLGGRDNRVPSYPSFSLDTLRSLPIPDFAALDEEQRGFLASRFDWLQDQALQSFPQMHLDPVRQQIDDAVTQALGLDADWVASIRRELAREPSITDTATVSS